jgi:hypothetical protein
MAFAPNAIWHDVCRGGRPATAVPYGGCFPLSIKCRISVENIIVIQKKERGWRRKGSEGEV